MLRAHYRASMVELHTLAQAGLISSLPEDWVREWKLGKGMNDGSYVINGTASLGNVGKLLDETFSADDGEHTQTSNALELPSDVETSDFKTSSSVDESERLTADWRTFLSQPSENTIGGIDKISSPPAQGGYFTSPSHDRDVRESVQPRSFSFRYVLGLFGLI